MKNYFYYFNFLMVHISTNNILKGLKLLMLKGSIHIEETVPEIFVLSIIS